MKNKSSTFWIKKFVENFRIIYTDVFTNQATTAGLLRDLFVDEFFWITFLGYNLLS